MTFEEYLSVKKRCFDLMAKYEGLFMADDKAEEGKSRRKKTAVEMRGTSTGASGIAGGPGGNKVGFK